MLKKLFLFSLLIVGFITMTDTARAQNPPMGDFKLNGTLDNLVTVRLTWDAPLGGTVSKYFIYRSPAISMNSLIDSSNFVLVDSTTLRTYSDNPSIQSGTIYAYVVSARTNNGIKKSTSSFVMFPTLEFRLSASLIDSGRVRLN